MRAMDRTTAAVTMASGSVVVIGRRPSCNGEGANGGCGASNTAHKYSGSRAHSSDAQIVDKPS